MGLFRKSTKPAARHAVLPKGVRPGDLLVRRNQLAKLIQADDAAYDAQCRHDGSTRAKKRYRDASRAYQKTLKDSTPAERKAAENAVKHAPWRKGKG